MSNDTPGTSPGPETVGEGDENQLTQEDTLLDRGVDDLLDEGYSPPERDRSNHYGETAWEEATGEGLDRRLAEEVPDDVDTPVDTTRSGRLVEHDDGDRGTDLYATDAGIDGAGASAEEASVHIVDEI
ncbi:DUF5709 domain-containing protein [Paraoerskovia marina]|uniref:DUF5709 domain-containing protein n=1 Tax=Paraoerskovia marina TaxID=545619 RepID=UPI000492737B|nr:DUF5709 domain-containing protein [Paraoerskovia marina]